MVNIPLFIGCQPSQIGGYRISQPPTETGTFLLAKGEHDDQPVRKYGEKSPIFSHTTVELDFLVVASLIWRDLQRQVEDEPIQWPKHINQDPYDQFIPQCVPTISMLIPIFGRWPSSFYYHSYSYGKSTIRGSFPDTDGSQADWALSDPISRSFQIQDFLWRFP
jgi:hypothetical protein